MKRKGDFGTARCSYHKRERLDLIGIASTLNSSHSKHQCCKKGGNSRHACSRQECRCGTFLRFGHREEKKIGTAPKSTSSASPGPWWQNHNLKVSNQRCGRDNSQHRRPNTVPSPTLKQSFSEPRWKHFGMGFQKWIWGVYEYLCFLVAGVIIAINDGNPIERLKRKYYLKWPAVRLPFTHRCCSEDGYTKFIHKLTRSLLSQPCCVNRRCPKPT